MRNKRSKNVIHLPTFAWNVLSLRILPLTCGISVCAATFSAINVAEWSWTIFEAYLLLVFIICFLFFIPILVIFSKVRKNDSFLLIDNGFLLVKSGYHIQKYDINAVDLFKVKSTGGLASNPVISRELVILDKNGEDVRLYGDDWSSTPRRSWRNLGKHLEIMTGKKVIFEEYQEDMDGEIFKREEFYTKQFKKKRSFF